MQTIKAQKTKYSGKALAVTALAACILPAPFGFIAASVGGALADLLSGYAVWAIPTAVIKALNVLPFFLARKYLQKKGRDTRILHPLTLSMLLPTTAVTSVGYFAANMVLYDSAAAWAEVPFNLVQSAVGAVLFIALALTLDAVKLKQKISLK